MGKHIITFKEKMLNEGLLNNKIIKPLNSPSERLRLEQDRTERILSEYKSPIHSYIQKAKTPDEAETIFVDKWKKISTTYHPRPELEIISIQEIGEVSDEIHIC